MKLGKKLLIAALLAALLTPTATASTQKPYVAMMLLVDGNTQPGAYEDIEETIIFPTSIHITTAV